MIIALCIIVVILALWNIGLTIAASEDDTLIDALMVRVKKLESGERKALDAAQERPICGCTHDYAFHETNNGRCRYMAPVNENTGLLTAIGVINRCPCQGYAGPQPLPQYIA